MSVSTYSKCQEMITKCRNNKWWREKSSRNYGGEILSNKETAGGRRQEFDDD